MPAKQEAQDEAERAALAIWDADYLVIVAGPSFYEATEKTVFASELCDHTLLQAKPEKFYGFWGQYHNRYLEKTANDGYSILRKWRDNYFDAYGVDQRRKGGIGGGKQEEDKEAVLQRCYVVTATIDGSFARIGFPRDEIYEMCGSINNWQCWIPCKPEVWAIDPHFRFDVDPVLGEAKPIKWVTDSRPPFQPEVYTLVDGDEEGPEEELPPLVLPPERIEKSGKEAVKKGKDDKRKEPAAPPPLGRLSHATAIPLHVAIQEVYPNMARFVDHFMPTPTSNLVPVPHHTFPGKGVRESYDASEEGDQKASGPEQPYILLPRLNHCLNHLIGLHTNKYTFHHGTFDHLPPNYRRMLRRSIWQSKQRFFEASVPEIEAKRKQHVFYNISVAILDPNEPGDASALLTFEQPGSQEAAAGAGTMEVPLLPPLRERSSSMQNMGVPVDPASISPRQAATHWEQGRGGRYYFSYVPVSVTHVDPDGVCFDTMHIEFPADALEKTLPKRGKVSVIVECCEYPEPKPRESSDTKRGDKKKKDETVVPTYVKLDPILEPVQYSACQLIGRFSHPTFRRAELPQSNVPYRANDFPVFRTEQPDDFVYTMTTRKGHVVDIGSNYNDPSTIRYVELEIPVFGPESRDLLHGPIRHELVPAMEEKLSPSHKVQQQQQKKKKKPHPVPNFQRCVTCGELARPNVVMDPKKDIRAVQPSKKPYQQWETAMSKALRNQGSSLVILEMGCEKKVDVSRKLSEKLFKLVKSSGRCTFIRLATEDLEKKAKSGQADADKMINMIGNIQQSLSNIDHRMQEMKRRK
eukprot:GGOE01001394.1.p1 GENE.GGOE01001394.1~~GGOE01001394.1.p1  ORF type:complete len:806 (+),score=268.11 GGOE01001394.1:87-2504(+)